MRASILQEKLVYLIWEFGRSIWACEALGIKIGGTDCIVAIDSEIGGTDGAVGHYYHKVFTHRAKSITEATWAPTSNAMSVVIENMQGGHN
jgi:hypothetical protein